MIAIERHVIEANDTSVCVFTASKGGLGGGRLVWQAASCLLQNRTRKASFVVVPQLGSSKRIPSGVAEGISSVIEHAELRKSGLVHSVLQAAREDTERAPDVDLRVLVLENASALALSHCMEDVVILLRECVVRKAVHAVLAAFQQQAHPATEMHAVSCVQTCNVTLQPVRSLQADMIYKSQGQRVHVEMVVSTLRHSGRVRVEKQLFSMTQQGDLKPCNVKPPTMGDTLLQSSTSAVQDEQEILSQKRIQSKYEKEMSGFMKLTLSDKEQERKANTVLPWQHEGETQQNTPQREVPTGEAAIMYVRDSDQDYDSDEDPDDDLDL